VTWYTTKDIYAILPKMGATTMSKITSTAEVSARSNAATRLVNWLVNPLRGQAVANYGYTVNIDDYPGQLLPDDATVERFEELLRKLPEYYPGTMDSLSRVPDPGEQGSPSPNGKNV
jgi:hypothetical protein